MGFPSRITCSCTQILLGQRSLKNLKRGGVSQLEISRIANNPINFSLLSDSVRGQAVTDSVSKGLKDGTKYPFVWQSGIEEGCEKSSHLGSCA